MMGVTRSLTLSDLRRLVISRQHLDGAERPQMLDVIRDLGCLQLDPISAVQRSHLLVLHSRMGQYDPAAFESLLYKERVLFEYWAHVASIVLTEDYPIHAYRMQRYGNRTHWGEVFADWFAEDEQRPESLRDHVLNRLRGNGALPARAFEDREGTRLISSGWTGDRNINRMLDFLWHSGEVMVSHRQGIQRIWDLAERVLPDWTPREHLTEAEVVRRAAQRAIRALGAATVPQIRQHYTRSRYPDLQHRLDELKAEGLIEPVRISADAGRDLPGVWYLHSADIPHLERIQAGDWQPSMALLSPFDNLICDRKRTELLWDFYFRIEIYVPKAKRQYGYYVLPILQGDRLIGRIDPLMDRKAGVLRLNAIYAEAAAPDDAATVNGLRQSIEGLAQFLGAQQIDYPALLPQGWQGLKA